MLDAPQIGWVVSELILGLGLILFVIPCWRLLWLHRAEHHRITWACLLLLIPDLVQIFDFIPAHLVDLARGVLIDDAVCKASAFIIVACILASNGGNIMVAWTTKRMLDPSDQKVTGRELLAGAAVSWVLGLLLAGYFLGQGYLGSHRGVYCCTNQVARWDIAGIVFLCYGLCIAAMAYYYRKAWKQVHTTVFPSSKPTQGRGLVSGAGGSSLEKDSEGREGGGGGDAAVSPRGHSSALVTSSSPLVSPTSRAGARGPASPTSAAAPAGRVSSASSAVARRAVLMISIYYTCWLLIFLNAIFELAGWSNRSIWWDICAKWGAKCQPAVDAYLLSQSIIKAQERKAAAKNRAVPVMDSQQGSTADRERGVTGSMARSPTAKASNKGMAIGSAASPRPGSAARPPSAASSDAANARTKLRGVSSGGLGVIEVKGALHPLPRLNVDKEKEEGGKEEAKETLENGAADGAEPGRLTAADSVAESATSAAGESGAPSSEAGDGLHHRRTASSDIATY